MRSRVHSAMCFVLVMLAKDHEGFEADSSSGNNKLGVRCVFNDRIEFGSRENNFCWGTTSVMHNPLPPWGHSA